MKEFEQFCLEFIFVFLDFESKQSYESVQPCEAQSHFCLLYCIWNVIIIVTC